MAYLYDDSKMTAAEWREKIDGLYERWVQWGQWVADCGIAAMVDGVEVPDVSGRKGPSLEDLTEFYWSLTPQRARKHAPYQVKGKQALVRLCASLFAQMKWEGGDLVPWWKTDALRAIDLETKEAAKVERCRAIAAEERAAAADPSHYTAWLAEWRQRYEVATQRTLLMTAAASLA